jgi:uncharacterized membrane protein YidH (DUF202 family)
MILDIFGLIIALTDIINFTVPFLIGLGVFLIIYGILGYISNAADEEKRAEARKFILWGVVAVFIMISVWSLVNILYNTFNLDNYNTIANDTYGKAIDADGRIIQPEEISGVLNAKPSTIIDLITRVNVIGSRLIPFLIGIGVLIIILGILGYIKNGDNEEKRAEGRMFIIWGIVSIFIMLSVWGLVNILVGTFNLNNAVPNIPKLPTLEVPTVPTP